MKRAEQKMDTQWNYDKQVYTSSKNKI